MAHGALDARTAAQTFSIATLLQSVEAGTVRIPSFQRAFKWDDEDRRKLFDSIGLQYPIGTLLLWRTELPEAHVQLGGFVKHAPPGRGLQVIDGHQRIATLATGLLGDARSGFRPIYYDLVEDRFVLGRRDRPGAPHLLPTSMLLSSSALLRWLREAGLEPRLVERADSIAARVREYVVPAYVLETDDEGAVKDVFARINDSGRRLESHEVFDAMHAHDSLGIGAVARGLRTNALGKVEEKDVERSALAILGRDPGRSLAQQTSGEPIVGLLERTARALSRAVTFLAEDAGILHLSLLPYASVLPLLARFFDLYPQPHPRTLELLARWVWRGAAHGTHRTDLLGLSASMRAIDGDEHQAVAGLLGEVPASAPEAPETPAAFNVRYAQTKLVVLAMAAREPRELDAADRVVPLRALFELVEDEGQEPPIVSILPTRTDAPRNRAGSRLLLAPGSGKLARERLARISSPAILASHLVGDDALRALRLGDHAKFVALRSEEIDRWTREHVAARAKFDPTDRDRLALEAFFSDDAA